MTNEGLPSKRLFGGRRALTPLIRSQRSCDQKLMRAPASDGTVRYIWCSVQAVKAQPAHAPAARSRAAAAASTAPPRPRCPPTNPHRARRPAHILGSDNPRPGMGEVLVPSWGRGGEPITGDHARDPAHRRRWTMVTRDHGYEGTVVTVRGGLGRGRAVSLASRVLTVLGTCSSGIPVIRSSFFLLLPASRPPDASDPGA